ncbi:hypothetical protein UD08_00010 [Campylobacter coli]|uniref:hypothetical protein n=1 Tax=Campylobacter coli TaxID=195 RepID=UPI000707F9C1|nr:hypothetical protein [Campylobacter coli]KQH22692.1 hypothetical protein UD08_00010 [Campylobacter coli]
MNNLRYNIGNVNNSLTTGDMSSVGRSNARPDFSNNKIFDTQNSKDLGQALVNFSGSFIREDINNRMMEALNKQESKAMSDRDNAMNKALNNYREASNLSDDVRNLDSLNTFGLTYDQAQAEFDTIAKGVNPSFSSFDNMVSYYQVNRELGNRDPIIRKINNNPQLFNIMMDKTKIDEKYNSLTNGVLSPDNLKDVYLTAKAMYPNRSEADLMNIIFSPQEALAKNIANSVSQSSTLAIDLDKALQAPIAQRLRSVYSNNATPQGNNNSTMSIQRALNSTINTYNNTRSNNMNTNDSNNLVLPNNNTETTPLNTNQVLNNISLPDSVKSNINNIVSNNSLGYEEKVKEIENTLERSLVQSFIDKGDFKELAEIYYPNNQHKQNVFINSANTELSRSKEPNSKNGILAKQIMYLGNRDSEYIKNQRKEIINNLRSSNLIKSPSDEQRFFAQEESAIANQIVNDLEAVNDPTAVDRINKLTTGQYDNPKINSIVNNANKAIKYKFKKPEVPKHSNDKEKEIYEFLAKLPLTTKPALKNKLDTVGKIGIMYNLPEDSILKMQYGIAKAIEDFDSDTGLNKENMDQTQFNKVVNEAKEALSGIAITQEDINGKAKQLNFKNSGDTELLNMMLFSVLNTKYGDDLFAGKNINVNTVSSNNDNTNLITNAQVLSTFLNTLSNFRNDYAKAYDNQDLGGFKEHLDTIRKNTQKSQDTNTTKAN